jgi:hypothetical protein
VNLNAARRCTYELRSAPQGHASYRTVAQDMHRAIAEVAGHRLVADMMSFVDHGSGVELERLEAERRAEARRTAHILSVAGSPQGGFFPLRWTPPFPGCRQCSGSDRAGRRRRQSCLVCRPMTR